MRSSPPSPSTVWPSSASKSTTGRRSPASSGSCTTPTSTSRFRPADPGCPSASASWPVVCRVGPASAFAGASRSSRREGDVERVEFETIVYEKDGGVARIILNTPDKANIQTAQQVWDMDEALVLADDDDDVKVLVLKANGEGFCAGHAIVGHRRDARGLPHHGPDPRADLEASPPGSVPVAAAAAVGVPQSDHRPGARLLRRWGHGVRAPHRPHHRLRGRLLPDAAAPGLRAPRCPDHDRALGPHELQARRRSTCSWRPPSVPPRRSTGGW